MRVPERDDAEGRVWAFIAPIVSLPLRILLVGLAVITPLAVWHWLGFPGLRTILGTGVSGGVEGVTILSAALVTGSGLFVIALLWWLIDRYFRLVQQGTIGTDAGALRDLPLGLPEGTIRSVLALFVAAVGLPILILSNTLGLGDSIAGYVNGIISGVFGFYFGSRMQAPATQALNQIAAANRQVEQAQVVAQKKIAEIEAEAERAKAAGASDAVLGRLSRHLELSTSLIDQIGSSGAGTLLPADLQQRVDAAQAALDGLSKASSPLDPKLVEAAQKAADDLITQSPIDFLLKLAAPMVGKPALLASLLAVGWQCGSAAYQRWSALVLAAPITSMLLDPATVTGKEVGQTASSLTNLPQAWTEAVKDPHFIERMAELLLDEDAADHLWVEFGKPKDASGSALTADGFFQSRQEISAVLEQVKRELLSLRFAQDLTSSTVADAVGPLSNAEDPAFRPSSEVTADSLVDAARSCNAASATGAQPDSVRAAFDALAVIVGICRLSKIDFPTALGEIKA